MTGSVGGRAAELFNLGYNCAEAVLLAVSKELEKTSHVIPSIATGFGGGIGRSGSTCGALTGAVMIGIVKGRSKAEETRRKEEVYNVTFKIIRKFERKFGSSICRVLTQSDLWTPEGLEKFHKEKIRLKMCTQFVEWCAEYVFQLLKNSEE